MGIKSINESLASDNSFRSCKKNFIKNKNCFSRLGNKIATELHEIKQMQNYIIPKTEFQRFMWSTLYKIERGCINTSAWSVLHEYIEGHLINVLGSANMLAKHKQQNIVTPKDFRNAKKFHLLQ